MFGFRVSVDLSWLILAVLVTWTLATGYFPVAAPDLGRSVYFWMGVTGMFGLALSIILHELSHSLVARRFGMPIEGITLFIFGGVAEMSGEPPGPRAEFFVAIMGPIASFTLALGFYFLGFSGRALGWPQPLVAVIDYLSALNLILAIFNLIPAFPLDGGRVLRAVLWGWRGQYLWATRIAANFGDGFGVFLIVLAVLSVITGNFVTGMWWFLIGLFVRGAAKTSYQQAVIQETLSDVPVSRLMTQSLVTVGPDLTLDLLVEEYIYRHSFKTLPVIDNGRLIGCVELSDIKAVPRAEWRRILVREVMQPIADANTVPPEMDAVSALRQMLSSRKSRLLVARGPVLVGIISQSDILRFLAIRLDLGREPPDNGRSLKWRG